MSDSGQRRHLRAVISSNRDSHLRIVSVHFSHTCFVRPRTRSVLTDKFSGEGRDVVSSRTLWRLFGVRTMRPGFEASSINVSIARVVVGSSAKLTNSRYFRRAMRADARSYEVARRYGIAERILFRWKQETDAGGTAVRGGGYRGCAPPTEGTHHDAASSGREGSPGLRGLLTCATMWRPA